MMVWFRWFSVSIGWFFRFHANLPGRTLILLMVQKFGEPIDVGFYIPVSIEFLYIPGGCLGFLNHQQYLFKPNLFHWMNSSCMYYALWPWAISLVLRNTPLFDICQHQKQLHYWIWLTNDPQQISCLSHQIGTRMSLVIPVSLIHDCCMDDLEIKQHPVHFTKQPIAWHSQRTID